VFRVSRAAAELAMQSAALTTVAMSVCLSVTCFYHVKTPQAGITDSSLTCSLVFARQDSSRNSKGLNERGPSRKLTI